PLSPKRFSTALVLKLIWNLVSTLSMSSIGSCWPSDDEVGVVKNLFGDNGDIWMGYTQSSRWQVYNTDNSRPFRETNYEPEVLLVFRNNYQLGGWKGRMAAVGIN